MYVRLITLGLAVTISFWFGYKLSEGRCASAMLVVENDHRNAQNAAIEAASKRLKAESEQAIRAAEERGRRSSSAKEVINEVYVNPDDRDCEWSDAQRMRVERIYNIYRERPSPPSNIVSDILSDTSVK